jgi:hypothetical protein
MGEVTAFWWKLMLAGAEQRGQTTREFLRPKKSTSKLYRSPTGQREEGLKYTKKLSVEPVGTVRDSVRKLSSQRDRIYFWGHECTVNVFFEKSRFSFKKMDFFRNIVQT